MRTERLLLSLAILTAGCQTAPASHVAKPASPPVALQETTPLAKAAQLAHDGGIVYATALSGINDVGKRQEAAAVSTSLAADLRAERTMRDAELLVEGALIAATAGYWLPSSEDAEEDEQPEAPEDETPGGQAPDAQNAEADVQEEDEAEEDERVESEALAAWRQQSPDVRKRAKEELERRKAELVAKLAATLSKKAQHYQLKAEKTMSTATGGKEITTTLLINRPQAQRTILLTRKFDAEGTMFQTVQKLDGMVGDIGYAGKRTRTLSPDGSIRIVTETAITIERQVRVVRWDKRVDPNGAITATGTLRRPDDTIVQLTATGQEGGAERVVAQDVASGLSITVQADAVTGVALTTVDAGAVGSAAFEMDRDDEDEDEVETDGDDD